ncbi:GNAT family N-acetyltransferase [Collinsella sp. AGMB00827]|uniref:GNAT family N-acetyltransferase n=1 Tax=Collinsella ureilytica TaxID=2869515 RepID=A0ABS7MLP8_9ACTN|nr:GNAT family N-acetyltransferase [Collinsella urealyticum]MBY4798217.1 GNAT family N-acetyltransferase [Collinsella urealyticum]
MRSGSTVVYRTFQDTDFHAIALIMERLWHADSPNPDFNRLESHHDCAYMLAKATYSQVAVLRGEPVGIVLARAGAPNDAWSARWNKVEEQALRQMKAFDDELMSSYDAFMEGERRVNRQLAREAEVTKDAGELVLLAVDAAARGHGVGKHLLAYGKSYLAERQALPGYLFTDTSCDWRFYEYLGLTRVAQHSAEPHEVAIPPEMYLYRLDA